MTTAQETHVQILTKYGLMWTKAWSTDVPGLFIVYDADRETWSVTHKHSGRSVLSIQMPMVNTIRNTVNTLKDLDWTIDETVLEASTEHQSHLEQAQQVLNDALLNIFK